VFSPAAWVPFRAMTQQDAVPPVEFRPPTVDPSNSPLSRTADAGNTAMARLRDPFQPQQGQAAEIPSLT
jgi:hypothetical protein